MQMFEADRIRKLLGSDARIIFVSGNFNVLHPGHVRVLRFAQELGGYLIVGLHPDDAAGVDTPVAERIEAVSSSRYVTSAFAMDEPIEDVIRTLKPVFVVKGREHEHLLNPEATVLKEIGGKLLFSSGEMLRQTASEIGDEIDPRKRSILPSGFLKRHNIQRPQLFRVIKRFGELRVMVIGDLIVDDYVECDPIGMSQEDPTLVVTPRQTRRFVGGAGIVAAHGQSLGAQVTFISVTGDDELSDNILKKLEDYSVTPILFKDSTRPTTLKQRLRASGKTLLRVSHMRQHSISKELADKIFASVQSRLSETDLILFSDFSYGCLPHNLILKIMQVARQAGITIGADSQVSSQIGDISKFKKASIITPTELEARLAVNKEAENLSVLSEELLKKIECENVILTLGADGVLIRARTNSGSSNFSTDRIHALNSEPKDVAGAGDSLFCVASLAVTLGESIWTAALLGSIAAACQVGRVGNTPLTVEDMKQLLEKQAQ
jgi:rfaE bifunctional protein kinase chain/domain